MSAYVMTYHMMESKHCESGHPFLFLSYTSKAHSICPINICGAQRPPQFRVPEEVCSRGDGWRHLCGSGEPGSLERMRGRGGLLRTEEEGWASRLPPPAVAGEERTNRRSLRTGCFLCQGWSPQPAPARCYSAPESSPPPRSVPPRAESGTSSTPPGPILPHHSQWMARESPVCLLPPPELPRQSRIQPVLFSTAAPASSQ